MTAGVRCSLREIKNMSRPTQLVFLTFFVRRFALARHSLVSCLLILFSFHTRFASPSSSSPSLSLSLSRSRSALFSISCPRSLPRLRSPGCSCPFTTANAHVLGIAHIRPLFISVSLALTVSFSQLSFPLSLCLSFSFHNRSLVLAPSSLCFAAVCVQSVRLLRLLPFLPSNFSVWRAAFKSLRSLTC